jgi:predicted site-specific integrase-resolvase
MPRPKLDPDITQRIVDLVRAGHYLEVAATAAGIHKTTLHRWLRIGREQKRGRYRRFLTAVERAQAEAESRDVALIARAATDDWRAAAWRLERQAPRRYGPRVQLSVNEELEATRDRLKAGLDEATYAKVLELVAAEGVESAPLFAVKDPYAAEGA